MYKTMLTTDNELPWVEYLETYYICGWPFLRQVKEHLRIRKFVNGVLYIDKKQYAHLVSKRGSFGAWNVQPYGWII